MSARPIVGFVREVTPDDDRWIRYPRPSGYRHVLIDAFVPEAGHLRWRAVTALEAVSLRCRYTVGPGRAQCKKPPVVMLNRSTIDRPRWWAYCSNPQHLFGRRLEDGRLLSPILVGEHEEVTPA